MKTWFQFPSVEQALICLVACIFIGALADIVIVIVFLCGISPGPVWLLPGIIPYGIGLLALQLVDPSR